MMLKNQFKSSRGFTITEIMIAITIALILLSGVMQVFSSTKKSNRLTASQSRIQENLRFSADMMAREIRMAGYTGCNTASVANSVNPAGGDSVDLDKPIQGYGDGVALPPEFTNPAANTDAFLIIRGGEDTGLRFKFPSGGAVPAASFFVNKALLQSGLAIDEIIMLTDCKHTAAMQITNLQNGNGPNAGKTAVIHNTGAGSVGNCTINLNFVGDCGNAPGPSDPVYPWGEDAFVIKFVATGFYIREDPATGERSLYRVRFNQGVATAEELVRNVQDMQIAYGVDSNADGYADRYARADQVAFATKNVVSVRIGLLFESADNIKTANNSSAVTYNLAGTNHTVAADTDRKLRYAFNTTVKVRNVTGNQDTNGIVK